MEVIEPYIVSIITQLSNMRIPISTLQGLQLCNSIVNGTRFKNELQQFKKKTFKKRPRRARSWILEGMYKEMYTALVAYGLAVKHEESYWRNAAGDVVELEKDAVGCQSAYELSHRE